jgi:hypothetical protein
MGKLRGPIRITIPASVGFHVDKLRETMTTIGERLGCPKCFSGAACLFTIERNFVIDERLTVRAADPDPLPWKSISAINDLL